MRCSLHPQLLEASPPVSPLILTLVLTLELCLLRGAGRAQPSLVCSASSQKHQRPHRSHGSCCFAYCVLPLAMLTSYWELFQNHMGDWVRLGARGPPGLLSDPPFGCHRAGGSPGHTFGNRYLAASAPNASFSHWNDFSCIQILSKPLNHFEDTFCVFSRTK